MRSIVLWWCFFYFFSSSSSSSSPSYFYHAEIFVELAFAGGEFGVESSFLARSLRRLLFL